MGHIFISYSRKDEKYVASLVEALEKEGFDAWLDREMLTSDEWVRIIKLKIDECDAFVVVVTENSDASTWVRREVLYAMQERKKIFPLLLQGKLWMLLQDINFFDVRDGSLPSKKFFGHLAQIVSRNEAWKLAEKEKREAAQKAEEERIAKAKIESERKAKEEADRFIAQRAEEERIAKAKIASERKAKEEADRLAAQKAEEERIAKAKIASERKAKEEAGRLATQKAKEERLAREKIKRQAIFQAAQNFLSKLKIPAFVLFITFISYLFWQGISLQTPVSPVANFTETETPQAMISATFTVIPPTKTLTPAPPSTLEPTPAPVGIPVRGKLYEVTVLNVKKLDRVIYGGYYWTAKLGQSFVEMEVKASNLQVGLTMSLTWNDMYLIESNNDKKNIPAWGGFKSVESGSDFLPSSVSVRNVDNGLENFSFKKDLYLRLVYTVTKNDPTTFLFVFSDCPKIEVAIQ